MANIYSDFKEIVRKIENKSIILPDFQREFAWKDEEQQKKIVASVLARMPIGSILLLKSSPSEYCSKQIGCQTTIDESTLAQEVEFLLDGQQRITVLTNVFSNIIHTNCKKVSELISPTLKRRFFLKIPKWTNCKDKPDLFGVFDLQFKYLHPDSEDPEFLSSDIFQFITCETFLADDKKPYNPQIDLSVELDNYCINNESGYLIPLFLLIPPDKINTTQYILRYDAIRKKIATSIGDEIINHFEGLSNDNEKDDFIDKIISDVNLANEIKKEKSKFRFEIENREVVWNDYFKQYLDASIKNILLNKIVVKAEQRARAIDIYENLNRGGVSLNTFDLVMARVAKVNKSNFYQRIVLNITSVKSYNKNVLPENICNIIGTKIDDKKYNATKDMGCYKENKNEISSKYIDAFLNVLSLYCSNKEYYPDKYKIENIKREQILRIDPKDIDLYTEKICISIDRALFFFQTRCGIRSVQEINYSLMIVLVATIFTNDNYFNDKKIHNKLEAWYWASIFSGEYDKDQNATMISNLQFLIKSFNNEISYDWLLSIKNMVLNSSNFSDEAFLLMEKVNEDRVPKVVIRQFICQYLLSMTYVDLFNSKKIISAFDDKSDELEAHHIIPLGTVKKIGDSTSALRRDVKHLCNSPLNFVLISKQANKEISDDPLDIYAKKICDEAKSVLYINAYTDSSSIDDETKIKNILKTRYSHMKGKIKAHIEELLL